MTLNPSYYTKNSEGVTVLADDLKLEVPVEKITPVSTIGAGDNFNAGIAHYLLSKGVLRDHIPELDQNYLKEMLAAGIRFATHVCLSYDNYISREFAEGLLS